MGKYKPTGRPRGAPKGSHNALKHGLYARHYSPAERNEMRNMKPLDPIDEIYMLRSQINKIVSLITTCEDEERRVKLFNSLFTGTQRLLAAMRTQHIIFGKVDEGEKYFMDTLAEVQEELGLRGFK